MSHLLCFGLGFTGRALAHRLSARGWRVTGTSRSLAGAGAIAALGYRGLIFDGAAALAREVFAGVSHVVISVPPDNDGDPVLRQHAADLAALAAQFSWVGYLSTTGVYGDQSGGWVTEASALAPSTERGARRLAAEADWLELHATAAASGSHFPAGRHLRARPQSAGLHARRHRQAHREAGPGVQPDSCRGCGGGAGGFDGKTQSRCRLQCL